MHCMKMALIKQTSGERQSGKKRKQSKAKNAYMNAFVYCFQLKPSDFFKEFHINISISFRAGYAANGNKLLYVQSLKLSLELHSNSAGPNHVIKNVK